MLSAARGAPRRSSQLTAASSKTTLDRRITMLTYEEVAAVLEYRPEVGGSCLVWKVDRISGHGKVQAKAGDLAGYKDPKNYWLVRVNRKLFKAHRLVWLLVHKEWPPCQVDHIYGAEVGNRVENLRLAFRNNADNTQNTRKYKNNTSGLTGVSFHKKINKWQSYIRVNNVQYHLGYFDTAEEAYAAYLEAKARLHTFNPVPR